MIRILCVLFAMFALAPNSAIADGSLADKECAAKEGHTYSSGRCFTGQTCTMRNGLPGFKAIKDGAEGCSVFGPEYTEELREKMKDPAFAENLCRSNPAWWWSQNRCFTGKRCQYRGAAGFVAIKDGLLGCSQEGPRRGWLGQRS